MNKQKISAYLEESLKPWHPSSAVIYTFDNSNIIIAAVYVNEYIKYLIKDKS